MYGNTTIHSIHSHVSCIMYLVSCILYIRRAPIGTGAGFQDEGRIATSLIQDKFSKFRRLSGCHLRFCGGFAFVVTMAVHSGFPPFTSIPLLHEEADSSSSLARGSPAYGRACGTAQATHRRCGVAARDRTVCQQFQRASQTAVHSNTARASRGGGDHGR